MSELREGPPKPQLISEVEPIEESTNRMIVTKAQIKKLVERPLVPACEIFWDKNVETLSSSANRKNIDRTAFIVLNFDSMSAENQAIAKEFSDPIEHDGMRTVNIEIPIKGESVTVEEIERKAVEIAEKFKKQKMTWAPRYTIEQLREIYTIDPDDESFGVDGFVKEGYYYDEDSKLFYLSEEHFKKATEEIEE